MVLERLRPLQEKIKYQVDKHVKVATEGVLSANDPLRFKGDLDNIVGSSSEEEEDEEEQQEGGKKKKKKKDGDEDSDDGKIYKPPKITQMKYGNGSCLGFVCVRSGQVMSVSIRLG